MNTAVLRHIFETQNLVCVLNRFLFCCLMLMLLSRAGAQLIMIDPIDTDRPDQTESPVTISKNWMQIEHGFDAETDNENSILGSSTLFRYGLSERVELRVCLLYTSPSPRDS